jgi:hypothetical protein
MASPYATTFRPAYRERGSRPGPTDRPRRPGLSGPSVRP